jgi:hypothetical protein
MAGLGPATPVFSGCAQQIGAADLGVADRRVMAGG